jgi:septum formation protein
MRPSAVIPADIDETPRAAELPRDYVMRMAREKAAAIAAQHPTQTILAADTIVALGRRILGKPIDGVDAARMLDLLSGRRHHVMTAVVVQPPGVTRRERLSDTVVQFKRLTRQDIADYIDCGEWEGKAGAYAIQGHAEVFVRGIYGSFSGVVGLPLYETAALLRG